MQVIIASYSFLVSSYLVIEVMVLIDPVFQGEVGEDIGALRNEDLAHRVPENSKC